MLNYILVKTGWHDNKDCRFFDRDSLGISLVPLKITLEHQVLSLPHDNIGRDPIDYDLILDQYKHIHTSACLQE